MFKNQSNSEEES